MIKKLKRRVNEYYGNHLNEGLVWQKFSKISKEFFLLIGAHKLWRYKKENALPNLNDIAKEAVVDEKILPN